MESNQPSPSKEHSMLLIVIMAVVAVVVFRVVLWQLDVEVHPAIVGVVTGAIVACTIPFLPKKRSSGSA